MTRKVYTSAEVCAMLGISPTTLSKLARDGCIRRTTRGCYTQSSVDTFAEEGAPCEGKKAKAGTGTMRKHKSTTGDSVGRGENTTSPIEWPDVPKKSLGS